ncbi:MAG TPA: TetR family transcriptional regulator [Streptosporangiaceae bacterium]|nr:TetR family transcriptional regulator [Streptosporangiaceae bacterium]
MTVTPGTTALAEQRPSLRERKKLATRRALRRVALDLVAERGFAHVTIEDIAEAADVSPRTFFNYFPSKEAALFGADPDRTQAVRLRLVRDLPGQSALEALRVVLVDEARALTEEFNELGGDPAEWLRRMKASHVDPHLRAARAAHLATFECAVADALAERLGTDPARDPYPLLLASAGMGVMRAAFSFWGSSGGTVPLDQLVDGACRALAQGLPENCELRAIVETSTGAGPSVSTTGVPAQDHRKDDNS